MIEEIHTITYGNREISFRLEFVERKTMTIKVLPDTSVNVIVPLDSSILKIEEKVKSKAKWIVKQKKKYETFLPHTTERKFVNGETHLYLGRQYLLAIEKSKISNVKLYRGKLIVNYPKTDSATVEKILKNWYREKAQQTFEKVLIEKIQLFQKYNISKPEMEIKWMAKRWGSCTKNGKITLNTELIKAPKACIDYVLIHELCHLVHHNHTRNFYDLQSKILPDWERWKERLEMILA